VCGFAGSRRSGRREARTPPGDGRRSRSGENLKRSYVFRADHSEVPSIERRDDIEAESLGKRHDGCVDSPKRQIAISSDELCDPYPIACENRCRSKAARGEIAKEPHFGCPAKAAFDEIGDFGDDKLWDQQRSWVGFKQLQACLVVAVVLVDIGVKRSGIDDQRDRRASCRMLSSMRRAVSRRPLRPALAAIRRRRVAPPT
jgi:hypothetical protein